MSTPPYTPYQQTPDEHAPDQQAPDQKGGGPSWFRIWIAVIGTAVVGALIALAVVLSQSHSGAAPATGTPTSTSAPAQPTGGATTPAHPTGTPTTPVHPTGTPTTPAKPSAAVAKLQQELGQLNYYNGPANGIMGPQTVQAIKYLQRDAHLPQTGQINAATQAALTYFLAHGNNHMAG